MNIGMLFFLYYQVCILLYEKSLSTILRIISASNNRSVLVCTTTHLCNCSLIVHIFGKKKKIKFLVAEQN